jgi:large subunit ribosomal protein L4e
MKTKIISKEGKSGKEIEVPVFFSTKLREDIISKAVEAEKQYQIYFPSPLAGKQYSASGKIRHIRHKWKTAYGRGISRVPRKIMWRRGTQFYWIGATVSGTKGGRRAHGPKPKSSKNINKKEYLLALKSAISATSSTELMKNNYKSLKEKEIKLSLPIVVDSSVLDLKTKDFISLLKSILSETYETAIRKKTKRAGKGKTRGRKYKKSLGMLMVIGNQEKTKISFVEIKKVSEISVSDFGKQIGRITIYTEKAIQDLKELIEGGKKQNA